MASSSKITKQKRKQRDDRKAKRRQSNSRRKLEQELKAEASSADQ